MRLEVIIYISESYVEKDSILRPNIFITANQMECPPA